MFVLSVGCLTEWDTKAQSTGHSHKPNIFIFLSLPKNLWLGLRITSLSLKYQGLLLEKRALIKAAFSFFFSPLSCCEKTLEPLKVLCLGKER